jgi:DNA-binding PadR family transcriptional regulator
VEPPTHYNVVSAVPPYVGEFEQLVLLAILQLESGATGAAIRGAVEAGSRRRVWIGAVYTTLQRLEDKGLIRAAVVEPATPGDRRRKVYAVTSAGQQAVRHAHDTWQRMTRGLAAKLRP